MALTLSVLTLNIWGIPVISKDKNIRVEHIAERIEQSGYDIISLQEVWSDKDFHKIKLRVSTFYPYSHYFYSGVFGSGLCVFSKHRIMKTFFHHWSVNGYVQKIQHGDWYGGKGVGLCKIKVKDHVVNFYVAHLHAEYDRNCDDYMTHRIIQAFDTAQFLENTRSECSLQILAGDLNTEPMDLAYRVLLSTSGLKDAFLEKPIEHFSTHQTLNNTYTSANEKEIRIDYILYRATDKYKCEVENYDLPFIDKIPELNISYSDHEAVLTRFKISPKPADEVNEIHDKSVITDHIKNLEECIAQCHHSLTHLDSHRKSYSVMAIGMSVLLISIVEFDPVYGFKIAYMIMKFILCGFILFFMFMASLWNMMERRAVLSGKLSMENALAHYYLAIYPPFTKPERIWPPEMDYY